MANSPPPSNNIPVLSEDGKFVLPWWKYLTQNTGKSNVGPQGPPGAPGAPGAPGTADPGTEALALLANALANDPKTDITLLELLATANLDLTLIGGSAILLNGQALPTLPGQGPITIAGAVSFGAGAPVTLVVEGATYYDTSASPYTQYVQHSAAWHQVA